MQLESTFITFYFSLIFVFVVANITNSFENPLGDVIEKAKRKIFVGMMTTFHLKRKAYSDLAMPFEETNPVLGFKHFNDIFLHEDPGMDDQRVAETQEWTTKGLQRPN